MSLSTFYIIAPALFTQLTLIFLVTAGAAFAARKTLKRIQETKSAPAGLKTLADGIYVPTTWLICGYGIFLLIETIAAYEEVPINCLYVAKLRYLYVIVMLTWATLRWKRKYEKFLRKRAKSTGKAADEVIILGVGRVVTIVIFTVSALMVLDLFDIQLTALLAFGGIGGLSLGWAAKDIVLNLFGGLTLFINRPFSVGEMISCPNKNIEGVVEDIGWYMTQIRTYSRRPTYIPNAIFIDAIVENGGRMYNRRVLHKFGIRYEDLDKVEKIITQLREMLDIHKDVDQEQFKLVHLIEYADYSVVIELYCFTTTTKRIEWLAAQQDILLKVAAIVKDNGADFPFPTNTIYLEGKGIA